MENNINLRVGTNTNQENECQKLELKIDGISCQACVAKIERKLSKTNGVEKALVNISNNMADIEYNEKEIKASEIMKIIEKLGYTPKRREDLKDKEEAIRAEKKLKFYEDELKLISKFEKINSNLREINKLIEDSKNKNSDLSNILDIIQKKNNEIIENDL